MAEFSQLLREYDQLGYNVVPLRPADKRPPERFTLAAYFTRRSLPAEWDFWWPADGGEERNIGIVTGAISNNLVVLDLDDEDAYWQLIESVPWLGEAATVQTGRGYHCYLRSQAPPGATFTLKLEGHPGRHHVKADGGYVVAPPSVHPTGARYKWTDRWADRECLPPMEVDLPVLVQALTNAGFTRAHPEPKDRPENWHEELFARTFNEGERTDYATSLVGLLRYYISDRPGITRGLMHLWNERHCRPPLSSLEIDTLIRSYYRRYDS